MNYKILLFGFGPEKKSEADRQKNGETGVQVRQYIWLLFILNKGTNLSLFPEIKKSVLQKQMSVISNKVGKDM